MRIAFRFRSRHQLRIFAPNGVHKPASLIMSLLLLLPDFCCLWINCLRNFSLNSLSCRFVFTQKARFHRNGTFCVLSKGSDQCANIVNKLRAWHILLETIKRTILRKLRRVKVVNVSLSRRAWSWRVRQPLKSCLDCRIAPAHLLNIIILNIKRRLWKLRFMASYVKETLADFPGRLLILIFMEWNT